jgi:hypothetical protein
MKSLAAIAATLFTMLAAATSSAHDAIDVYVDLDPKSVADVHFEQMGAMEFGVKSGIFHFSTEDPGCTTLGCQMALKFFAVKFNDFSITADVGIGPSTLGIALLSITNPTIAIVPTAEHPVIMTNASTLDGDGFIVPAGTPVSFTATVAGYVNTGSEWVTIPTSMQSRLGELTAPLVIDIGAGGEQFLNVSGVFPFAFAASQTIGAQTVSLELRGEASMLGSGLTPFLRR